MFTVREWPLLLIVGVWAYMAVVPLIEVAEQTVIQRVVPFEKQGRVLRFAQAVEASAAPLTTFLVAPIADFLVIPYVQSDAGVAQFSWLLGTGDTRGIALILLVSGVLLVATSILAFRTKTY